MRLATAVVFILLTAGKTIHAQPVTCDFGPSPCEAYAQADAIFTGKVFRITPETIEMWQRDGDYDQIATVVVEKVYKGTARKRIVFHQRGRKSSPKLVLNSSYLFYANLDRQTKKWEVRRCGRTIMARYAQDDLRYLEGRPEHANQSRIAGAVLRYLPDAEEPAGKAERLAGLRIRITSEEKQYEVVTGPDGMFELYGAPPGKYVLHPDIPSGFRLMGVVHYGPLDLSKIQDLTIELKERECSGATILLERGE
ncbi:MAG TPA: hypothetical protein VFR78_14475 [Pyrinomonadaceae bacterium]|nr:hypothetical protein [Pyrinomonadaceae bacterium]